jgi:uncharacterized RDD family membrane protein YckC
MHCKHCGFDNSEDEHRCLRCGRRLTGVVIAAPPGYSGANALAVAAVMARETETLEFERPSSSAASPSETGGQTTLFAPPAPGSNVIPFEQRHRQPAKPASPPPLQEPQRPPAARKTAARKAAPPVDQGTLDFIPAAPAKNRRLRTDVDAQVFCEQPVATPAHRFVASCVDGGLILVGFSVLVIASQALGGSFDQGKMFWLELAAALTLVSVFYGLIWAIAGRETAGMRFTDLQLITFDGFPLDGRSRALRFAATCLSICSGGLGILWAVADEENLTWHDHISKTFPTIREDPRTFVKQRR